MRVKKLIWQRENPPNRPGLELHWGAREHGRREYVVVFAAVENTLGNGGKVSSYKALVGIPHLVFVSASKEYDIRCRPVSDGAVVGSVIGGTGRHGGFGLRRRGR